MEGGQWLEAVMRPRLALKGMQFQWRNKHLTETGVQHNKIIGTIIMRK